MFSKMTVQKLATLCFFLPIIVGILSLATEGPTGILACKTYNTSKMDCSRRYLLEIPVLDKNGTTMLDLSHNQLKEIYGTPFGHLQLLTILDISNNMISNLNSTVFQGLYHFLKLDLSVNELTVFSRDVFCALYNLLYLDVSGIPLHEQ